MNWISVLIFISLTSRSSSVPIYEQCGGVGYTGPSECNWPLKCFHQSMWYAQCRADCPTDWLCQNSTRRLTQNPILPTINITAFTTSGLIAVQKRSLAADNDDNESMFGSFLIAQMLGSDSYNLDMNSFQLSKTPDLLQVIGDYILEILKEEEETFFKRFRQILTESDDVEDIVNVLSEASKHMERMMTSSRLKEALIGDPLFLEKHAKTSMENVDDNESEMQNDKDPCNGPTPDIGEVNGSYGSESRLDLIEEIREGYDVTQNLRVNAFQLAAIDHGFVREPDPESRLGAYYATRNYKPGTVGGAIHRGIGSMFLLLSSFGEEKIGRIYNNQVVKALLNQPIESAAIQCVANIEQLYFKNVEKENPKSLGVRLGVIITPRTRGCLSKLLSGVFCSST